VRTRFWLSILAAAVALLTLAADLAAAHHPMGGKLPATMAQGFLSGIGHPIIGLDHLAAVLAVGCIAAWYRTGPALAIGFVVAMIAGVALHLGKADVPASEILVALSVIALGAALVLRKVMHPGLALALFVIAGLLHGYALGESIVGAEPTPLAAYLIGLAAIQATIALGAMVLVRRVAHPAWGDVAPVRLVGAGIVGVGLATLVQQVAGPAGAG
jgi:urease accessory protein